MLAMPMMVNPGFEVAKIKESRAPRKDFPLWGREDEREALLEIATAMCFLNSGADLLMMYHPAGRSHPEAQDRRNDVLSASEVTTKWQ